ncbi:hypothetical protein RDI58_013945 [Solanum bulbocastanum]|uniref:Uncharacterized protein n=1 Tax=Solanum bulbocastanum TaxID=147425 RepID=A0AAN8TLW7_SOLBU
MALLDINSNLTIDTPPPHAEQQATTKQNSNQKPPYCVKQLLTARSKLEAQANTTKPISNQRALSSDQITPAKLKASTISNNQKPPAWLQLRLRSWKLPAK